MFLLTLNNEKYKKLNCDYEIYHSYWLRNTKKEIMKVVSDLLKKIDKKETLKKTYGIENYRLPYKKLEDFTVYEINEDFLNKLFNDQESCKLKWQNFIDKEDSEDNFEIKYILNIGYKCGDSLNLGVFPFGFFTSMEELQEYLKKEDIKIDRYRIFKFNNECFLKTDVDLHKETSWRTFYIDYLNLKGATKKEIIDKIYDFNLKSSIE